MNVVDVVVASLLYLLLSGTGGVRADNPKQPVHGVRQGRQKSAVSSHVGLCEALQYPCLIGTVLPHPTVCQLYLQCVFPGVGEVGVSNNWIVRSCSQGTMFDRHQLFCVLPSGVECAESCENNGTIPGLADRDITDDPKVKEKSPPPNPQGKTLDKRVIPRGDQPVAERPSIPLSETLYLPETRKSQILPQGFSTMGKSQSEALGEGEAQRRDSAQRREAERREADQRITAGQRGGAVQYGGATQGEQPQTEYRQDTKYPVYRSNDHSQDSRGPRQALGQLGHIQGQYPPHRPSHHSHNAGARERLRQERVEPRKGLFPEYRPSDYEIDDHKGAWKQDLRPEYMSRTEDGQTGHPEALTDRLKTRGHNLDHRISDDSEMNPLRPMGRDAQQGPKYGSSTSIQKGVPQRSKVRGVDAKQAPDNEDRSPEQFWWDALNLLYSQEVRDNGERRPEGLKGEQEAEQAGQNAPKSRNWRRKNQKATNWNNRQDPSPTSLSRNRKEPTARNWEARRDTVDPTFQNLNRDNPSMRNSKSSGYPAQRGTNREKPPIRKYGQVELPWRTREMPQIFLPQTTVPVPQSQSQFPVRLAIPTPLPIPEPSTLGARLTQAKTSTYGSRARDVGRSGKFPSSYRAKSRDVTKSAKPEKNESDQRRSATTRSINQGTKLGPTTEASSTIMPWGTFYNLLRKYALESDSTPSSNAVTGKLGPSTPAVGNGPRRRKESKAGMPGSKIEGGADHLDHATTPRSPYLGIGRSYRLRHSESTHGENEKSRESIRHGDRSGLPPDRNNNNYKEGDNNHKEPSQKQAIQPDYNGTPSKTRTGEREFIPIGHQRTVPLPEGKRIDPSDIPDKVNPGVPKPRPNPRKDQGLYSQQRRPDRSSSEVGASAEKYSIEEPPSEESGTSSEELLKSIEGMFPDLDLSDLDPVELERFLDSQISSAEVIDMADTTDTTSTTEMATTTWGSDRAAAALTPSGTILSALGATLSSQQPPSSISQPKSSIQQYKTSKSPSQQPKPPSTQIKAPSKQPKSGIPLPKSSSKPSNPHSEQPKSPSEQPRTVRIPLSSLTDRLLQQRFTNPSSQSSAAEAASRVRALYRFLRHRLRLQGYRPVLKIAELPVTPTSATAGTDVTVPKKKGPTPDSSTMGHSDEAGSDTSVPSEAYKEESYIVTPSPTTTKAPKAATATTATTINTTTTNPTTATTTTATTATSTSATTTTTTTITTKSSQTQSPQATSRATTVPYLGMARFVTTQSSTEPTEEAVKRGDHKIEPGYKDGDHEPDYGIREGGLKQTGVEKSYRTYTLASDKERKSSAAMEDSAATPSTQPASKVIPYITPSSDNEENSGRKSSEIFEINPAAAAAAEDLPGERDGTEIKDPRDREVFHLPKTTVSHRDSFQGVTMEYGHVAMPTMHEGDSRSYEMVYSVSEERPEGNNHHTDSTTEKPNDKPSQKSRQSPKKDSPVVKDSLSERESPYNWGSPSQKDSSQLGKSPSASHTKAPSGGDSLKPLIIPGAMPPPGGWRRVEHKMLLGHLEGVREELGQGLDKGLVNREDKRVGQGMDEEEGLEEEEGEVMEEHMTDSQLFEHIHPKVAPSYERINGVDYESVGTERVEPTATATATYTQTDATFTRNYDLGDKAASTVSDNRGSYSPLARVKSGQAITLPLTTPTAPPLITIDMRTYHLQPDQSMDSDDTLEPGNMQEVTPPITTSGQTENAPTDTNPAKQTPETSTQASGSSNSDRKVSESMGSPTMSSTHQVSPTTQRYDTIGAVIVKKAPVVTPTSAKGSSQAGPSSDEGVNRTVSVVYVDDVHHGNGSKAGVEGLTTDNIPVTTTTVSWKGEGVSVGLIVGVSFVVLLLFAIAMLPVIFCFIYKRDRKQINDNYMDRTDISTLASFGVNDRNYHSTTTLASVGSTRPLIRTPSWINKMLLFKKLNRKSVSDHCLVNMYHERQHPSTDDLYGSHGNPSCHLATKYASLSTERAASRKKRKSCESSSRMDDVISDFADESVFYLKRPKVKTKHLSPSVV